MFDMSALELSRAVRERKVGAVEATRAFLDLIEKTNGALNAFLAVPREKALASAARAQALIDRGEAPSPLAGVPVAVKDNICTAGVATTCGSRMLEGYAPPYSATVVDKMEAAGMVVLGKLNMDEFAMGGSNETSAFGAALNPWDLSRVPGGSSGGSAAAVASGQAPLALGTDTGGSVRQPCAFCGITGVKPTYGAVSRYGLLACASSLDQIGPMARDIDDCAALLSVLSGPDPMDATCSIGAPFDFSLDGARPERLDGLRIGLPANYFDYDIDPGVKAAVLAAARVFEDAGAIVEEFRMPLMDYMVPAYFAIACAEASSNMARYDGLRFGRAADPALPLARSVAGARGEGFGEEVKRRALIGAMALLPELGGYYQKAQRVRALVRREYARLFERFDAVLSPVAATGAYGVGENLSNPAKMRRGNLYTVSVNLAGLPAVALPCGFDGAGLPAGIQLAGRAFSEPALVAAARVYQARTDWHSRKPPFFGGEVAR